MNEQKSAEIFPLRPANITLPYLKPFFRNDDVAVDSNIEHFTDFCTIFHKLGFTQVHGIMLRGLGNVEHLTDGVAVSYAGHASISTLPNEMIRKLSEPHRLADNTELVAFLNTLPDELALHGLYHTDYSTMSLEEQLQDMQQGLEEMHMLFPEKPIRYFIAPFNRHNIYTHEAAHELGLRVLYDDGVHLEAELEGLLLEPGVWYRYHHHRFYPQTRYTQQPLLTLAALEQSLQAAKQRTEGNLPYVSENIDLDIAQYASLVRQHKAQNWFLTTALDRRHRHELQSMSQWVHGHIGREQTIFELCCGGGSNLLWLAQNGYTHIRGSDNDPRAVALTNDYFTAHGMAPVAEVADYLDTSRFQKPMDVFWTSNCLYLIPSFCLSTFLHTLTPHLSAHGCFILDIVDTRFRDHPYHRWHSADWGKPESERRPSEYRHLFSLEDVKAVAQNVGLHLASATLLHQSIPRIVIVLARTGVYFPPRLREISSSMGCLNTVQTLQRSGLFDRDWYIKQYVHGPLIMEPLEHYIRFGAAKNYNPSADFDTAAYRRQQMAAGDETNPLVHFFLNNPTQRSSNT